MTQEFIIQFNKKCAEFLELVNVENKYLLPKNKDWYGDNDFLEWADSDLNSWKLSLSELRFHANWNWIMEVVSKIVKLGYVSSIDGNIERSFASFIIQKTNNYICRVGYNTYLTKKQGVVEAINQFIDWYNFYSY